MLLDYADSQVIINEEDGESFVELQGNSNFQFCARTRNGKFEVPYVSLPLLIASAKRLEYPLRYTDSLRSFTARIQNTRATLSLIQKAETFASLPSQLQEIHIPKTIIEEPTEAQKLTALYGIFGKRVLIASGVGSGKTLTANLIAKHVLDFMPTAKILVMTPASLVDNYHEDYVKFFGGNDICKITTQTKEKREVLYKHFMKSGYSFLLTNFDKCNWDYEWLYKLKFDAVICDEFHCMKNYLSAKRSINFFQLIKVWNPIFRLCLTGTPIENRLLDLYPTFKFLDNGFILGGQNFFETNFVEFEEHKFKVKAKGSQRSFLKTEIVATGFKNHVYLKSLIKPLIIKKKTVLPVKLYQQKIIIEPTKNMMKVYNSLREKHAESPSARYHACRQFLCDPSRESLKDDQKWDELWNLIDQMDSDDKMVVFSFYKCTLKSISEKLQEKGIGYKLISGDESTPVVKSIADFASDPNKKILICTDKINYGVNKLQCARYLVNYEMPLKPSTYIQRCGRLYRMGQKKDVHVYNFVVENTVEADIMEMFDLKREVIDGIIESLHDDDVLDEEKINEKLKALDFEKKIMQKFNGRNPLTS